jgi:SAM-dependent methyltransferase
MVSQLLPEGGIVCDVGCGSGAMTQRLIDGGYEVLAIDSDLREFSIPGVETVEGVFVEISIALARRRIDLVLALEVIEHTESPAEFLRALMRSAPMAILSFPNIHEVHNLRRFWREGAFDWWNPPAYWDTGHQSIIPDWLFEQHCQRLGIRVAEKEFSASWRPRCTRSWLAFGVAWLSASHRVGLAARTSGTVIYRVARGTETHPRQGDGSVRGGVACE